MGKNGALKAKNGDFGTGSCHGCMPACLLRTGERTVSFPAQMICRRHGARSRAILAGFALCRPDGDEPGKAAPNGRPAAGIENQSAKQQTSPARARRVEISGV